jgi:hypothetical protein
MTFLAPGYLFASLAVAAAIAALHFIVTRQPRSGIASGRYAAARLRVAPARRPSDFADAPSRLLVPAAARD